MINQKRLWEEGGASSGASVAEAKVKEALQGDFGFGIECEQLPHGEGLAVAAAQQVPHCKLVPREPPLQLERGHLH
jgi:hypothetical protein